ncbi:MAG: trigger factor [Bacteroidota bacterium]
MEIILDKKTQTEALIKVSLKQDDYQPKVEQKIKEYSKKADVKGFRKGKVPTSVIKKMYGKSILVDEINHLLYHSIDNYIKEEKIKIIGEPIPNKENVAGLDWDNQTEFEFEYNIGIVDDFTLDVSKKQKVNKYEIKIDDKVRQETIDNLLEQHGNMINPDVCEDGDSLFGTFTPSEGEGEYSGLLDLKLLDKKDSKKFVGVKPDGEVKFDIKKVLKTDTLISEVLGIEIKEVENIEGEFTLKVKNVNRKENAELNQEFYDRLFGKDAVKTEEEFNKKIEDSISQNYSRESDYLLERDSRDHLVDKTKIETPDEFLKEWLLVTNEGKITKEQIDAEFDLYIKDLKWTLIRNKIAEDQQIKVEQQDINDRAKLILAEQFGGPAILDQLGDKMDEFVKSYLEGNEGQNYTNVVNQVLADKVYAYVKENISINNKKISLDDFRKRAQA